MNTTRTRTQQDIKALQHEVHCHEALDESADYTAANFISYLDAAIGSEICTIRQLLTCGGVHPNTEKQIRDALTRMSGVLTDASTLVTDPDALD